jgi:hypothetical protein
MAMGVLDLMMLGAAGRISAAARMDAAANSGCGPAGRVNDGGRTVVFGFDEEGGGDTAIEVWASTSQRSLSQRSLHAADVGVAVQAQRNGRRWRALPELATQPLHQTVLSTRTPSLSMILSR